MILGVGATAGVVTAGRSAQGKAPEPSVYLGLGFVFLAVTAAADVAPAVGAPLAVLIAMTAAIYYIPDIVKAFQKTLKSGPKPAPITETANPRKSGENLDDIVNPGKGILDPLMGFGRVIGNARDHGARAYGNWQSDNALDISTPVGTPVYAVEDGVISGIGYQGATGKTAGWKCTLTSSGNAYWYGHLSIVRVSEGERVKKGKIIGLSGSAVGVPHLHIGVRTGDPEKIFRKKGQ